LEVNEIVLAKLIKHADDIVYDKSKNTLEQWVADYGAEVSKEPIPTIKFGSYYALYMMLARRDKEVIRNILIGLGLYKPEE